MDKDTRNAIERATQRTRKLLEEDFAVQLEGDFDVHRDGTVATKAGGHLSTRQVFQRERIVAAIEQIGAVKTAVATAAVTPAEVASTFAGAPRPLVIRHLETLAMVGEVRRMPHGRYLAVTEPV